MKKFAHLSLAGNSPLDLIDQKILKSKSSGLLKNYLSESWKDELKVTIIVIITIITDSPNKRIDGCFSLYTNLPEYSLLTLHLTAKKKSGMLQKIENRNFLVQYNTKVKIKCCSKIR
ncbi:hypothetical protein RCL_jg27150.t1 [Rhizophagus clarus]|uniref:Uncharacterized protein n=1 Tax=Rhizophagus clarus TaxID=94130 RepID=A0A8H3MEG8_9GLOM|nr:hypothetical protein RCL_jg27150.t1 [Rhizophagus clarus]